MNETAQTDTAVIRRHLDWFARTGATEDSVTARRYNLQRLAERLPVPLLDATPDHLDQWQSDLGKRKSTGRGSRLTDNSIGTYTMHARAFYAWAEEFGLVDRSPAARLPRVRRPRGRAHPVPEKDLLVILAVAPEPIRTWLILAAFMGLRSMEVAQLRRDSVDEVDGRLVLSGVGKGRKPFRLIVPEHVEPSLRLHLHTSGALWSTPQGCPLTGAAVSRLVNRFFRKQGMPYSMHWVRHSFGTAVYAQTKDLLLTQDLMRHASPQTTRIYVETSSKAAVVAADRLAARMLRKRQENTRRPSGPEDGGAASAA